MYTVHKKDPYSKGTFYIRKTLMDLFNNKVEFYKTCEVRPGTNLHQRTYGHHTWKAPATPCVKTAS